MNLQFPPFYYSIHIIQGEEGFAQHLRTRPNKWPFEFGASGLYGSKSLGNSERLLQESGKFSCSTFSISPFLLPGLPTGDLRLSIHSGFFLLDFSRTSRMAIYPGLRRHPLSPPPAPPRKFIAFYGYWPCFSRI